MTSNLLVDIQHYKFLTLKLFLALWLIIQKMVFKCVLY